MFTSLVFELTMTPIAPDATHAAAIPGFGVGVAVGVGVRAEITGANFTVLVELSGPHAPSAIAIPMQSAINPTSRGRLRPSDMELSPSQDIKNERKVTLKTK